MHWAKKGARSARATTPPVLCPFRFTIFATGARLPDGGALYYMSDTFALPKLRPGGGLWGEPCYSPVPRRAARVPHSPSP
eukprot:302835-Prymnesium_polylepis.1